ncbi:MAG TPA: hypothetical protein VL093_02065, partial [Flavipsychrobacter sp.]|nr:hypothetical protein [Flavipsychrobacter sp.]
MLHTLPRRSIFASSNKQIVKSRKTKVERPETNKTNKHKTTKMKKIIIIAAALIGFTSAANAQSTQ